MSNSCSRSDDQGQFINLRAFTECPAFRKADARLPDWRRVRSEFPELIRPLSSRLADQLFITHRWDDYRHPDPSGWQLRAIRDLGLHYNFQSPNICFWYDFMSLPQRPRQGAEKQIFARGLNNICETVAECNNVTLVSVSGENLVDDLTALRKRGWIVFELLIARKNLKIPLPLYERQVAHRVQYGREQQKLWDAVVKDFAITIPFDRADLIRIWFERNGIVCTDGSDLKKLSKLLHKELTQKRWPAPSFDIRFDVEMRLTQEELNSLEFLASSRLSGCYPNLYMKSYRTEGGCGRPKMAVITLHQRPKMPELDTWVSVGAKALETHLIDLKTMRSPMYPGIIFEFDSSQTRLRATLLVEEATSGASERSIS